ncbi:MAG: hypothetical protein RSB51_05060 [Clostridia bacterium]
MATNIKKYEDNKLFKMLRKLKGIISKSQGVLDISLEENKNIEEKLKPAFHKYLIALEKECKSIDLNDQSFFDDVLADICNETVKIYLSDTEDRFFKENIFSKAYFNVETNEIYINETYITEKGEINEEKAMQVIAHVYEHYLYNRFKKEDAENEEYFWVEEGINEIASKRILKEDEYEYNNYVTYLKSAFRYRMLSGKNFDEDKIYAEHKLGKHTYVSNVLKRDFCLNIEKILSVKRDLNEYIKDKEFAEIIEDIYLKYVLDINKINIKNIQKFDYENEYKKYYTIAKNLNVNSNTVDDRIAERILDDLSTYCMKNAETQVEAIKLLFSLFNSEQIYIEEFQSNERKVMLITQILKMKSKYKEDVADEYTRIIRKYKKLLKLKNAAQIEIEPLTGRFQIKLLKQADENIVLDMYIDKGCKIYNVDAFKHKNLDRYEISTFLYDGTIKKDIPGNNIKVKKVNMQNDVERREYERNLKLSLTEYKIYQKENLVKLEESQKAFDDYFKRYISKYISLNLKGNKSIEKGIYKTKAEETANTVILKYFSKTSSEEFLKNEEANVMNLVNNFVESDKVYKEQK